MRSFPLSSRACSQPLFPATVTPRVHQTLTAPPASKATSAPGLTAGDRTVLDRVRSRYRERFSRLYDHGVITEYADDHSRADLALCSMLARETEDADQIERLFESSALARDKWLDRQDYRQLTISRAMDHLLTSQQSQGARGAGGAAVSPMPANSTMQPTTSGGGAPRGNGLLRQPVQPRHVERTCPTCGEGFTTKADMGRHTYCPNCRGKGGKVKTARSVAAGRDKPTWAETRRRVLKRDGWRCRYCGSRDALFASHILPRGHGGTDGEENLVAACEACHNAGLGRLFPGFEAKASYVRKTRRLRDV